MIIDAHSHYMPPEVAQKTAFFKVNWSDINRQLTLMDEAKIDKALLLYPTSDAHINMGGWLNLSRVYNREISIIVKQHKGRFIGAAIVPADCPDEYISELKIAVENGCKVVSLASSYDGVYLDDQRFYSVYEFAQKYNMPIHVHAQIMNPIGEDRVKDPLLTPVLEYVFDVSMCIGKMMMNGVFLKFPDVKFIFAHFGGVLPLVKERFDSTYTMLRKREFVKDLSKLPSDYFKNLYFDTSGTRSSASLTAALEVVDSSHILYGSDFPVNQQFDESISVIQNFSITRDQKNNILNSSLLENL